MKFFQTSLFVGFLLSISLGAVFAATPDGAGPWADEVISSNQGLDKSGNPIPDVRSDSSSTLGVAEETDADGTFFSLGFGGSLILKFDNPFKSDLIIIETTHNDEFYPIEVGFIEVSADGNQWFSAGSVSQDGSVSFPADLACAQYIRIQDTSNPDDFSDATADGYDVDGVRVSGDESCTIDQTPATTPSPTPMPIPTPTPSSNPSSSSNDSSDSDQTNNNVCTQNKPATPSLSVNKTSATTAELTWTSVSNVTHYAISYGLNPGSYQYGVANVGNTNSFVVGGLDPNANYYFIVRAINDCQPGDASNEVSVSSGGGQVLGLSTETTAIGGRGQVLGLSTDSLADTGSIFETIRLIISGSASLLGFVWARKTLDDRFQAK